MSKSTVLEGIEALEQIENTRGSKAKLEILKQHSDNEFLREYLMYTFNMFWTYNIKKIKDLDMESELESPGMPHVHWDNVRQLLDDLKDKQIKGNAAIDKAKKVLESTPLVMRKWFMRCLFRELQCGVQIESVNKTMGNYIPQYNVLLASKDLKTVTFPCYVEPKSDGMRCGLYLDRDMKVKMRTRNGHEFTGFDDIEAFAIENLIPGFMYDGELLGIDGSFKGIQKLAMKDATDKKGLFVIYDRVPIAFMLDKDRQVYKMPFERRRARLEAIEELHDEDSIVKLGETHLVDDMQQAQELYEQFVDRGYEGAMFKMPDMLYEKSTSSKRCKKMVKLKPEETIDLRIIGVAEELDGVGNPKGTLGKFILDYKGYELSVGSGLKDAFKDEVWANPNKFIGKIAEIRSDGETSNESGGVSLRFPRFITIRHDKDEADF